MEKHGNAARFHVASKANRAPGTLQGLCASRLIDPVRMNGIERGAQPLHMVTATDGSPAHHGRARALGALALLALSACLSNPPGVRGVAGTAPAPNVPWTPPPERHPRDTPAATPPPPPPPAPPLAAQQTTVKEAQTNLEAAEQRHRVGLATIADVLQAKTARSQAQLALETVEGTLQTTRGALALAMGLPANVPYDVELPPDTTPP